jgi:DNA modification methylase
MNNELKIEDLTNKIYHSKWEDMLPKIPDNSTDMIITSPPYNVNLGQNKLKKDAYAEYDDNLPYTEYLNWMTQLFIQMNRVLKIGGRVAINIGDGANGSVPTHVDFTYRMLNLLNFVDIRTIPHSFEPFKMMTTIIWDKQQIGCSTAWGSWQSPSCPSFPTQFEFILVFAKGTTKHEGDKSKITVSKEDFIRNSRALWTFPPETQMMKLYDHPAMFSEELPRRLIDQLTYEDDIVLDPFSGAGTTCAVAKQMNRRYIGIEMTEKYYNRSLERINGIPCTERINVNGNEIEVPQWMS